MSSSDSHSDAVLELAEEFLDRYRRGERPGIGEYVARYPELADQIREVFPAMGMMENIAIDEEALAVDTAPPDTTVAAPVLRQLGDYRIVREVGRGGMGIVYEAEQLSLGRHVALKVLPRTTLLDGNQKRRFDREARAAAKLHHTNIVPVFGVGEVDGIHYYVMQFIQGLALDEVIAEVKRMQESQPTGSAGPPTGELKVGRREDVSAQQVAHSLITGAFDRSHLDGDGSTDTPDSGPPSGEFSETVDLPGVHRSRDSSESGSGRLSDVFSVSPVTAPLPGTKTASDSSRSRRHTYWHSVARIGAQVGDALQHAHDQGILHRDIKPSNLLLDLRGTVWVTDFGLAKASDQHDITHTGDVLGTLRYMPPEAFDGRSDPRSDLYSLGLTLYELLAFRPAFAEADRHSLVKHVTTGAPPRLERLNPSIPRDLVTIVHKAIDREPDHRYRTAGELAADLQHFLDDEPIRARRIAPLERFLRWSRRNKLVASLGAALTAVLVIAAIASSVAAVRFRSLADEKERQRVSALDASNIARRVAYVSQINLAQQAAETRSRTGGVDALLDRWTYRPGQVDLRGWEWFYLRAGRDESRLTVHLPDPDSGAAWNPTAPLIATAMGGGVRVVDALSGAEVGRFIGRRVRGPSGWVNHVAWSPDGASVAAGCHDGTVRVWDAETSVESFILSTSGVPVIELCWSPDGHWLAVQKGNRVELWDCEDGGFQLERFPGVDVRCMSWRDGDRLSLLSAGNSIRTWDVTRREFVENAIPGELLRGILLDIAWNAGGSRLAIGYVDGAFGLWEASRAPASRHIPAGRVTSGLSSLAWSPDGERVAGIRDGRVYAFDVSRSGNRAAPSRTFRPRRAVELVFWSPDSRQLVTRSRVDRSLEIFDLAEETSPDIVLRSEPSTVGTVAWSPDGSLLAGRVQEAGTEAGASGAAIRIWDGRTRELLRTLAVRTRRDVVEWAPDGRRLAVPAERGIVVWDARTGEELETLEIERRLPYCLAWSADGRRLASGHRDGTVSISDVASGIEERALTGHEVQWGRNYVRSLAWSPDDRWLASVAENGTVNIWDVESSRRTAALQMGTQYDITSPLSAVQWSPDGSRLAATSMNASAQGLIWVWDVTGGKAGTPLLLRGHQGVCELAWASDGRRLASAGSDHTIKIWDVEVLPGGSREDSRRRSHELLTLRGHTAAVRSVSWNPLRPVLASSSEDGAIRLWDASPGYVLDRSPRSLEHSRRGRPGEEWTAADHIWRGETLAFLGEWQEAARSFDEAARLGSRDSDAPGCFLTPWWVAGYYDHDFRTPAPPEGQTDPWSPIPGDDGTEGRWHPVFGRVGDVVNFPDLLGPGESVSAYALTRVYSTAEREVPFLTGSDESIRLWVGGSVVCEVLGNRGRIADEDVFFVSLREGWNTVLARVGNLLGGHSLALRLSTEAVALARACEEADRWQEALGYWTQAIEEQPGNLEFRVRRGGAALRLGRVGEARIDFGKVVARHPESPLLRIRLASLYAEHGFGEESLAILADAGIDPTLLVERAKELGDGGQWRAAADLLRVVVQTEPQPTLEWHESSFRLAIMAAHLGETGEYRELCRRTLEIFRDTTNVQIAERMSKMCLFWNALRDPEVAREAARLADFAIENVAGAISRNEAPAWLTPFIEHARGIADYRRNRHESAIEWLRKSIEGMTQSWAAPIRATNVFFSAMASHRLGRAEESQKRLAEAESMANALSPYFHTTDRLLMETVRREARALILGEQAGG